MWPYQEQKDRRRIFPAPICFGQKKEPSVFPRSLRLGASNIDGSDIQYTILCPRGLGSNVASSVASWARPCWYNEDMTGCAPTFEHEYRLWGSGCRSVAGLDEAGRGALAGPVVAAAVVIDPASVQLPLWGELHDSKLLSPRQRAILAPRSRWRHSVGPSALPRRRRSTASASPPPHARQCRQPW